MFRMSVDDNREKEERLVRLDGISFKRKGDILEVGMGYLFFIFVVFRI